jgi:CubicO group peptidase (beta-lactamase class C family)
LPPSSLANGYIKLTKDITDAVKFNAAFESPRSGWLNTSIAAERIDAAAGLISTLADMDKFARALFRGRLLSARSQAVLTDVATEMHGAPVGRQETRALQGAMTSFGLVIFKEGDGPGGFNTLMAYHPESGTIFIGFTNEFGDFVEVDVMMNTLMRVAVQNRVN